MTEKLSWDEITSRYHDEWIELVDFEWDDTEPYPVKGVVRAHHPDKKEFRKILSTKERVPEAALLYTGEKLLPSNGIFSANLHQYVRNS